MLDMLKDVGGKTPDKCVALTDPSKAGSRVAESMPALLHKFRNISVWSISAPRLLLAPFITEMKKNKTTYLILVRGRLPLHIVIFVASCLISSTGSSASLGPAGDRYSGGLSTESAC